jgi:hypothetical protein
MNCQEGEIVRVIYLVQDFIQMLIRVMTVTNFQSVGFGDELRNQRLLKKGSVS